MRKCLFLSVLFLFFGYLGSANATQMTQAFYVALNVEDSSPYMEAILNRWPFLDDKTYGSVTFEDANIPQVGVYTIGYDLPWPSANYNEVQDWQLDFTFGGPWGDLDPLFREPYLYFMDGDLAGIYAMGSDILRKWWSFDGSIFSYTIFDEQIYWYEGDELLFAYITETFYGPVTFISVPEPATMTLLGLGLLGLIGASRMRLKGK